MATVSKPPQTGKAIFRLLRLHTIMAVMGESALLAVQARFHPSQPQQNHKSHHISQPTPNSQHQHTNPTNQHFQNTIPSVQ